MHGLLSRNGAVKACPPLSKMKQPYYKEAGGSLSVMLPALLPSFRLPVPTFDARNV